MKRTDVGGQGVLEGIMMRSKEISALAVRKNDGEIVTKKTYLEKKKDNWFKKLFIVRGVIAFFRTMYLGVKTLLDSAKLLDDEALQEETE